MLTRRELLKMFGIGVGVAAVPATAAAKLVMPPKENVITLPATEDKLRCRAQTVRGSCAHALALASEYCEYHQILPSCPPEGVDAIMINDANGNSAEFAFDRDYGNIKFTICKNITGGMERDNLNPINHSIGSHIEIEIQLRCNTMINAEDFNIWASPLILTYIRADESIILPEFVCESYTQDNNGQMEIIGRANVESTTVRKSGRNSFSPIIRYLC